MKYYTWLINELWYHSQSPAAFCKLDMNNRLIKFAPPPPNPTPTTNHPHNHPHNPHCAKGWVYYAWRACKWIRPLWIVLEIKLTMRRRRIACTNNNNVWYSMRNFVAMRYFENSLGSSQRVMTQPKGSAVAGVCCVRLWCKLYSKHHAARTIFQATQMESCHTNADFSTLIIYA